MSGLSKARVVVAGGGALGSCIALQLAWAGAQVTLADPSVNGHNASGVAAGMLAPALEYALDPEAGLPFALLRAARELWVPLAERLGRESLGLQADGGLWLDLPGQTPRATAITQTLTAEGAGLAPPPSPTWSAAAEAALFTPEDWRLAPNLALQALRRALTEAGGRVAHAAVEDFAAGFARLSDGERLEADRLVVATGAQGRALAPELAGLIPIRGQILKYPDLRPAPGAPSIRCAEGYATGGVDGLCVGATMEVGRTDLAPDPAVTARLHALAARLYPQTATMTPQAQVGVRAATPDGPPLIGPSSVSGVLLAAGARRNGWLLAPFAAQVIAAHLSGADPGPYAALFGPVRGGASRAGGTKQ